MLKTQMTRKIRKKSKYRHILIKNKKYYFYKIKWVDITGDSGHATAEEFGKFKPNEMLSFAYIFKKDRKYIWTFASYDITEEVFSDRNVFPVGVILKKEKINI